MQVLMRTFQGRKITRFLKSTYPIKTKDRYKKIKFTSFQLYMPKNNSECKYLVVYI